MIRTLNNIYNEIYLRITESPTGFEIQPGKINLSENFSGGQAYQVSNKDPNVLWDLLHSLIGIPHPVLHHVVKPEEQEIPIEIKEEPKQEFKQEPKKLNSNALKIERLFEMEEDLKKLSAKQIVEKIQKEKGITINVSLKSKALIIKKALKILESENLA